MNDEKTNPLMEQRGPMILTKSHLQSFSLNNAMQFILGTVVPAYVLNSFVQRHICVPTLVWTFSTSVPNYAFILVLQVYFSR